MTIKYIKKWDNKNYSSIIDVRSPSEFEEDHIFGSINYPVLYNNQREKIGALYKNISSFQAKIVGASLISKNISFHLDKTFINNKGDWMPLIYCWRGGKRSYSLAIILSQIGWRVAILKGGYKQYRKDVLDGIKKMCQDLSFIVISGSTGTAKTKILQEIKKKGGQVLDLEKLAEHKGSLLGKTPNTIQPSQKIFESNLYKELKDFKKHNKYVFVESESSKIGKINLPAELIASIKESPYIEIGASIPERISFLIKDYADFILEKDFFKPLFYHAEKIVGKGIINNWKKSYKHKLWDELAYSLISNYYDPLYNHNKNRKNRILFAKMDFVKINKEEINYIANDIILKSKNYKP